MDGSPKQHQWEKIRLAPKAQITVNAKAFSEAVNRLPKMRRAPAGANASIPTDTLIMPDTIGIEVQTPAVSSTLETSLPWDLPISVDARKLANATIQLGKIYQMTSSSVLGISFLEGQLCLRFETTTIKVPARKMDKSS